MTISSNYSTTTVLKKIEHLSINNIGKTIKNFSTNKVKLIINVAKQLLSFVSALCILVSVTSCEDSLSDIGASTMPNSDEIKIEADTLRCAVATGYRDSIYVRTGYPLLGNITDPEYGSVKAGYLAQFYASTNITLNETSNDSVTFDILRTSVPHDLGLDPKGIYTSHFDSLVANTIDSLTLRVYYNTYYGDSLTPMQFSVYALNSDAKLEKEPESAFYSNNDFSKYYDTSSFLGRKAYTAANRVLSDSVRSIGSYLPYIEVRLKDDLKNEFFKKIVAAAIARDAAGKANYNYTDIFANIESMRENFLSGVAIQPTFGDGSIIKVYNTAIYFYYHSYHKYSKDGTLLRNSTDTGDSAYVTSHVQYMAVTPDVVQMSSLELKDIKKDNRLSDTDYAYITSPQGYYATIDLPIGKAIRTMMDHPMRHGYAYFLNGANFSLMCEKPQGSLLSSTPASRVMLIEESKMNRFFEESRVPDEAAAAIGTYVADSITNYIYYYSFGNLNELVIGLAGQTNHGSWNKETVATSLQWAQQIKAVKPTTFLPELSQSTLDSYTAEDYKNNTDGIRTIVQSALDSYTVQMAVIPVDVSTSSQSGAVLSVSNYILPTAIKVKRDISKQYLQYIFTQGGSL